MSQDSQDNMSQNNQCNISKNSQDNTIQDAIIIIDMNKLPEEIREKFPKDLQDKLMELLQTGQQSQVQQNKNMQNNTAQNIPNSKPSGLFAVQQGYVSGNVYRDGILPEEKPVQKIKKQTIDKQNTQEVI